MFLKSCGFIIFCVIVLTNSIYAQKELEEILKKADQQRQIYEETFKNIFAEERKTYLGYDKNGNLKKSYQVESNFLVYQSNRNSEVITEYRNVTKFDGKNVRINEQNTEKFFVDLLQSNSVNEELSKIKFQSSRFDRDFVVSDLTLRQSPVLAEHLRPYFDFKIIGFDNGQYQIQYQQTKKSPFVLVNNSQSTETKLTMDFGVALPKPIRETNARVHGKLWIDANSFQICREERELTFQPENVPNPLIVFQINFEFGNENLEILVPQKITLVSYLLKLQKKELTTIKEAEISFEYSEFSQMNVKVKSSGILEPVVIKKQPKN
ncbi:MAG TPA: hypothetical protein PKY82_10525 [Pyrinomonadaceae bacterium]|nr:hypothetical protein [Pyrinomonadaceae bacterium]